MKLLEQITCKNKNCPYPDRADFRENGPHVEAFCSYCGSHIKFLNKQERAELETPDEETQVTFEGRLVNKEDKVPLAVFAEKLTSAAYPPVWLEGKEVTTSELNFVIEGLVRIEAKLDQLLRGE